MTSKPDGAGPRPLEDHDDTDANAIGAELDKLFPDRVDPAPSASRPVLAPIFGNVPPPAEANAAVGRGTGSMRRFVLNPPRDNAQSHDTASSAAPPPLGADALNDLSDPWAGTTADDEDVGSRTQQATPIKVTQHSALISASELGSASQPAAEEPPVFQVPALSVHIVNDGFEEDDVTIVTDRSARLARDTLQGVPAIGATKAETGSPAPAAEAQRSRAPAAATEVARATTAHRGHEEAGPVPTEAASPPRLPAWLLVALGFVAGVLVTHVTTSLVSMQDEDSGAPSAARSADGAAASTEVPSEPDVPAKSQAVAAGVLDNVPEGRAAAAPAEVQGIDQPEATAPDDGAEDPGSTDGAASEVAVVEGTKQGEDSSPEPAPVAPPAAQDLPAGEAGTFALGYPETFEGNDPWPIRGPYRSVKEFGKSLDAACTGELEIIGFAAPDSDDETRSGIGQRRAAIVRTNLEQLGFPRKRLNARAARADETAPASAPPAQRVFVYCSTLE